MYIYNIIFMTYDAVKLTAPPALTRWCLALSQVILHPTMRTIAVTTANKEEITNIAISAAKAIQLLK